MSFGWGQRRAKLQSIALSPRIVHNEVAIALQRWHVPRWCQFLSCGEQHFPKSTLDMLIDGTSYHT